LRGKQIAEYLRLTLGLLHAHLRADALDRCASSGTNDKGPRAGRAVTPGVVRSVLAGELLRAALGQDGWRDAGVFGLDWIAAVGHRVVSGMLR
jgi:hypothetical protein